MQPHAEGYITKRYTVEKIIQESSNVVFGTVTEVDAKRRTATVKVEENLKGTNEFNEIKIRFDVYKGEKDQRREIAALLKRDKPIIFFYLHERGRRIDALGHIDGTWFQTQATYRNNKPPRWWMFTHLEIYLNKDEVSKRESTPDFQKELRAALKPPEGVELTHMLVLKAERYDSEHRILSQIKQVGKQWMAYQDTRNRDLPGIEDTDILWLGFRALSEGRYTLNKTQEIRIKKFVRAGGIVIASGQDSDTDRPCRTGWLPEPLRGVESKSRNDFKPTSRAGELFKAPHRIRSGQLVLDDSWDGWNQKYEVLATTNNGKEIVVAKLKYGKGMYLITSLHNRNNSHVSKNRRMLENLMHFAIEFLSQSR